jgi:hypothetical protein
MNYKSTRTRIMEAAAEHGWYVTGDLSGLHITRGPVSLVIEFSTTGGIIHASTVINASTVSRRFTGSDRCGQVIDYLTEQQQ